MPDNRVVAIACGLNSPKKDYEEINKRNLYLNYGLLGLCTILKDEGYDVIQFQGEYYSPRSLINIIQNTDYKLNDITNPILVSITSFISIDWCAELTQILKLEFDKTCILGGKYVVDGNVDWLKAKLPYVDIFIEGEGEEVIENAIKGMENTKTITQYYSPYRKLDYSIVYNYKIYNPCIEIARGCGRGCVYCADGCRKQSVVKDPDAIIEELVLYDKIYDGEFFSTYFQMATFNVDSTWIEQYSKAIRQKYHNVPWRCTSRIDVMRPELMPQLADIGLKVIDLGLESASPRQLINMRKTMNPAKYLKQAGEVIREAYNNGIWIKLNILLSAGENKETVNETEEWLDRNRKYIKGVSVNNETVYGPYSNIDSFVALGARLVNNNDLREKGFAALDLSPEMNNDLAKEVSLRISQKMMSGKDYFELKKYGYFSRYYTFDDFCDDANKCDRLKLPFTID